MTDRRGFLAMTGVSLSLPLLTRCGAPSEGKTAVTCIATDPPSMNPAVSNDSYCVQASAPAYSWLFTVDKDGRHSPDLATSWEISPDARAFTFNLSERVLWHDGRPFSAADVKFTITQMISRLHPTAKRAYRALRSVETPDDKTVVIRFDEPNISCLALQQCFGPILPKHLWEGSNFAINSLDKAPVGTGPYKFAEYKLGQSIRYKRNEHYHFGGRPYFDELIISIIPDAVARSAAFENEDVDCIFANDLPSNDVVRLQHLPRVAAAESSYLGAAWLCVMNVRHRPLADKMVRQALAHAVDRKFLRETVLPNGAQRMVGPLYPTSPLYDGSLKDYEYVPAKASALLDRAGYTRGTRGVRFKLNLVWNSANSLVAPMAAIIARNLEDVGVDVALTPMEEQAVLERVANDAFDMFIWTYGLGPDPDFGMERLYNSNNIRPLPGSNNSGYGSREVDRLFDEQRAAVNLQDRKRIYAKIQELIWDDVPILPLFAYASTGLFHSDRITGIYNTWTPVYETFGTARSPR